MEKMRLKREIRGEINRFIKTKDILQTMNITNISNYQAFDIFKSLSLETLYLLTLVFYNEGFCNKVVEYVNKLKNIKLYITGNDLKEMGVEPGYKYKKF